MGSRDSSFIEAIERNRSEAEERRRSFKRADGLTVDDFHAGDIIGWDTVMGTQGGKVIETSNGEKLVVTSPGRCIPLRDVIISPSLKKLN